MERKKDEEKEKEETKKLNRALHFAVMKICEQEGRFFFFDKYLKNRTEKIRRKRKQEDGTDSNLPKKSYSHCQKSYGHI